MDFPIVIILILVTLGAVIIFALRSRKTVKDRKSDPNARKSTLAKDKDSKGPPADV